MPLYDAGVYFDSSTSQYHLSQLKLNPLENFSCYQDLASFKNSSVKYKIALLHIPYPFDSVFETQVRELTGICDRVFVIGTELHPPIVSFIERNDIANVTYYLCGFLNKPLANAQVKQFMDWFETSSYFYKYNLPEILTRLKPHEPKYRAFDILLGRKKQHRDFIHKRAVRVPVVSILTYFNDHNTNFSADPDKWQWELPGVKINKQPEWTVDRVEYFGFPMSISQILPLTVYNQTAYTVVAETCWQDSFAFFTEKTSKPIIARRLFVMFAGCGYLANLRQLGFKTFGDIIDESYDTETDALVRWQQAWDQVEWLAAQPQEVILEKIRPIVEHNFDVMMSTNWYGLFKQQLEQDFVRTIAG